MTTLSFLLRTISKNWVLKLSIGFGANESKYVKYINIIDSLPSITKLLIIDFGLPKNNSMFFHFAPLKLHSFSNNGTKVLRKPFKPIESIFQNLLLSCVKYLQQQITESNLKIAWYVPSLVILFSIGLRLQFENAIRNTKNISLIFIYFFLYFSPFM